MANGMTVIWESTGNQIYTWQPACGLLTGYTGEIMVEVKVTRGNSPLGDIGVDDVGVFAACPRMLTLYLLPVYTLF